MHRTARLVAVAVTAAALVLGTGCGSSCKKACRKIASCLGIALDGGAGGGWSCPIDEEICSGETRCTAKCFDDAACEAITGQDPAAARELRACQTRCAEQTRPDGGGVRRDGRPPVGPDGGGGCEPGYEACGDECADLRSSHAHCGGCGRACAASQQCVDGECQAQSGDCRSSGCGAGYYCNLADGRCLPGCGVNADCGGNPCNPTTHQCCKAGETPCSSACVRLDADPANCGECGRRCPSSTGGTPVCNGGECSLSCSSGTLCGGKCVDTLTDKNNCGYCGEVCYPPQGGTASCASGKCQSICPTGHKDCSGYCTPVQTDPYNCGDCNKRCTADYGATPACVGGECTVTCATDLTPCGTKCVNIKTDVNNCGSCGNKCTERAPKCTNGVCGCQYNCGDHTFKVCCFSNECCPNKYCTTYGCL